MEADGSFHHPVVRMELFPADVNIHGHKSSQSCPSSAEELCRWLSEEASAIRMCCSLFTALFSSAYPGTTGLAEVPPDSHACWDSLGRGQQVLRSEFGTERLCQFAVVLFHGVGTAGPGRDPAQQTEELL